VESRDLNVVTSSVKEAAPLTDGWAKALRSVERHALRSWSFGDLPRSILVEEVAGVPVLGYPGLRLQDGEVCLTLFKEEGEALSSSPPAVRRLAELALSKDLAWLEKELKHLSAPRSSTSSAPKALQSLAQLGSTPAPSAPAPAADRNEARENLLAHMLRLEPLLPLTQARFDKLCQTVRSSLPMQVQKLKEALRTVAEARDRALTGKHSYAGMREDVERLAPNDLLASTPYAQIQHLPRYLKAVQVRAERASFNPGKDAEKHALIDDFHGWEQYVAEADQQTFRWLLEEYRVSVFAPELGTAQPVSVKRLEALMR
jgi:ATP-dependent helicase HrpA